MTDDNGRIGGVFLPGNPFPKANAELHRLFLHYKQLAEETGARFDFFTWMLADNPALGGMSPFLFTDHYCEMSGIDSLPDRVRDVLRRDLMRLA